MSLPYPGMDFTAFDVLPAEALDKLVANIEALAAGTGLNTGAIGATKLAANAIKLGGLTTTTSAATTTTGSFVDASGFSLTVTAPGNRDILIMLSVSAMSSSATPGYVGVRLVEGSTVLGGLAIGNSAGQNFPITIFGLAPAPAAGSHTYKAQMAKDVAGTLNMNAGNGAYGAHGPANMVAFAI